MTQKKTNKQVEKPSKDDFLLWKGSAVGNWFFNYLKYNAEDYMKQFVQGATMNTDSVEATALKSMEYTTRIRVLHEIGVSLDYEVIEDFYDPDGADKRHSRIKGEDDE